jgi:hypothetical protein
MWVLRPEGQRKNTCSLEGAIKDIFGVSKQLFFLVEVNVYKLITHLIFFLIYLPPHTFLKLHVYSRVQNRCRQEITVWHGKFGKKKKFRALNNRRP